MFEDDFIFPNVGYVTVPWRVVDIPSTNWQSYTVIPAGTGVGPDFSQVEFEKKKNNISSIPWKKRFSDF